MNQPAITSTPGGGVSFTGTAAIDVYRISVLASSLSLYAACGMIPTRGMTITKMLKIASEYTRKPYKRGEAMTACADLKALARLRADIIKNG